MKKTISNLESVIGIVKSGTIQKMILFCLFLLFSCSTKHDLTGNWRSGGYSMLDKIHVILLRGGILGNCELQLNSDASWTWTGTCEVFTGKKWSIKNDSLLLFPDTCWGIRNSTLNRGGDQFKKAYFAFKIKGKCLERQMRGHGHHEAFIDSSSRNGTFILDKLEHIK